MRMCSAEVILQSSFPVFDAASQGASYFADSGAFEQMLAHISLDV